MVNRKDFESLIISLMNGKETIWKINECFNAAKLREEKAFVTHNESKKSCPGTL
jgi:hypothetical protein